MSIVMIGTAIRIGVVVRAVAKGLVRYIHIESHDGNSHVGIVVGVGVGSTLAVVTGAVVVSLFPSDQVVTWMNSYILA